MANGVCAVMLVKDEADVIEETVRHLCAQVDHVIVADNMSSDGTRELLSELELALPVTLLDDDEPGYYQSRKTTRLARRALELGYRWAVPCDADEVWYSAFGRLADVILDHDAHYDVVTAEMYDHVPTSIDPPGSSPFRTIGWRRQTRGALPKVAVRLTPDLRVEMGNHGATFGGSAGRVREWGLSIRHFPYRSPEQFVRKAVNGAAAYAAAPDIPDAFGGHWRGYGAMVTEHGEQAAVDWFHRWFYSDDPPLPPAGQRDDGEDALDLVYDPAPLS